MATLHVSRPGHPRHVAYACLLAPFQYPPTPAAITPVVSTLRSIDQRENTQRPSWLDDTGSLRAHPISYRRWCHSQRYFALEFGPRREGALDRSASGASSEWSDSESARGDTPQDAHPN